MKDELEAKFLEVDKNSLRGKLRVLGASCESEERIMRRVVFESKFLQEKRAWLRVRDEGNVTKLTLKQSSNATGISRIQEAEVTVGSFDEIKTILNELGLEEKRFQENYRESWKYMGVSIDIDTWPKIPTYVEIEGDTEQLVMEVAKALGFDYNNAVFGSADEVFKDNYGIDILKMDKLVFE